jgi:hypothetical protein
VNKIKIVIRDDSICWYKNGKCNRKYGPSLEYTTGYKEWMRNGVLHREDGPAVIQSDGTSEWYYNGVYHRDDGPAIEWCNGRKEWYLNDYCVYSKHANNLHEVKNLSEKFKKSIINYKLLGPKKE